MLVYIAAPWQMKTQAATRRMLLEASGIEVLARWIDLGAFARDSDEGARLCLEDIGRAGAVLLINPPEWESRGTGGRHVECGVALAQGKPVVVWGIRSNTFHQLPAVRVFPEWQAAALELKRLAGGFAGDGGAYV